MWEFQGLSNWESQGISSDHEFFGDSCVCVWGGGLVILAHGLVLDIDVHFSIMRHDHPIC